MSSPVCLEAVPAKRFLTTLGESTKRWLSALSLMYMEMERWHVPTAFHIRVPRIAKDEWRCNGGKCTQPNHTVPTLSLAGLFPHHAPKMFAHTVRFAVGSDDILAIAAQPHEVITASTQMVAPWAVRTVLLWTRSPSTQRTTCPTARNAATYSCDVH